MDTFLAICQGIGLAIASGLGGVLVPLFAGVLAGLEAGWSLDGTDWEFIGETPFLAGVLGLNVGAFAVRRQAWGNTVVIVATAALAGVLFAASLAEQELTPWPGLAAGVALALAAGALASGILGSAARRAAQSGSAEEIADQTNALVLFAAGGGLALALASLFLPPAALVAATFLLALSLVRRRAAQRKYAGLRVLR